MRMFLLAFLVLATDSAAAAPEALPEFEATYTVRYGLLRGSLEVRLRRHGDRYVYETSLKPRGLASLFARGVLHEATNFLDVGERIVPLDYSGTDTIAEPPRIARYVFHEDHVTGVYKEQQIRLPMPADGQNRISVHVATMQALRRDLGTYRFMVVDRARWKEYRFEVFPDQVVKTPAGRFETVEVRYSSIGDEKSSSLYFAPSLEFLPVMIVYMENGKPRTRAQLTDYRIEGRKAPSGAPVSLHAAADSREGLAAAALDHGPSRLRSTRSRNDGMMD